MNETALKKQCLEWLAIKGIFAYKQNCGGFKNPTGGFYRFSSMNGLPDIVCIIKGKYIGVELKVDKKEQSDFQIIFQENLEKAGGAYYIIRSLEDLEKVVKEEAK